LFVRLAANYGHIFKSQFKSANQLTASKKEWAIALSGKSQEQISGAIGDCQKHYMLPPTLPQFMALMVSNKMPEDNYTRLPRAKPDKGLALENLALIRKMLKGG